MEAAIFDDLSALADATRSRMLLVLERHELTVTELCAVLQLPQSTVSRHLKTLLDAEWVSSRRDGTSRYYTLALDDRGPATRRLWALLREEGKYTVRLTLDGKQYGEYPFVVKNGRIQFQGKQIREGTDPLLYITDYLSGGRYSSWWIKRN